ncbi:MULTISPECIES: TonB-dependent receptor [Paraburkholderia]|jgi:iron complex outermembrane receptor protein|uniref:Iron complex outermembrane recepter protein n=1 Tax=Paraburkholderia phenazinium TaxID=60549 RepID=A0A1N6K705_9BURK|nr:TonB-dependent receptor [Paraburkholderia phenazinium]SIO52342.1 iron complex outermembrane recepter protein [Paraburkholderia phenazinium]
MKLRGLTLAIQRIVWAEVALTAACGVPAYAQSQPAAATADAASATAAKPATATSASSPAATSGNVKQLQKFEVTGSLIRSSDKTGFNQVQTISQKDIEDSGSTTVADYLRTTTANSASSWSEGTSASFAPGGAGIALRGMSEKYTLVLVDGQRVAPFAFAVNGTDTFFDLNTLPTNMIDRIEIVKTGAVSQYGSDAIAGVVNIITKKDFQGLQLDGSIGGAQHGGAGTTNFSVLGGFGNLTSDGFNVTAAASYYRSSGITMAERDITSDQDYSSKNGGFFSQPASFWNTATGTQALSDCAASGGTVTSAANNLATQGSGTVCSRNGASAESIEPETQRSSVKVHADFKINDTTQAYADVWESYNTTKTDLGLAGFSDGDNLGTSLYEVNGVVSPFPATVGGTGLTYVFPTEQSVTTVSNFYRLSTGVKGTISTDKFGDWDWNTSYGHSQSEVSNAYGNQINASVLSSYLSSVTQSTFSSSTLNSLPGLFGTSYDQAISKLDVLDATISTANLFSLPAGDVGLGFGAQFQHQSEYIGAGSTEYLNPLTQAVDGERNVAAVYYQIDIPLLRGLTFSQSGRYDHYNDFGGAFSPRFALRYQPVSALTMYTSYNRGFRAPTLVETSEKASLGYQTVDGKDVYENSVGNPNLQPERTKNYNIGFELSPARNTDIGFDWYKIDVTNVIGQESIAALVAADPNATVYNVTYENLAYLHTDGFEGTFKQALPTSIGTFTLSGDWAYVWHFVMPNDGVADDYAGNNGAIDTVFGASFPRWRGNTQLSWAFHKWTTTLSWQFTGPYAQAIVAGSPAVGSYSQFNIYTSYSGFKHWTLYAGIDNIFNHKPPYDPVWQYEARGYYDTSLYTYVGLYGQVGATYKF